MGRGRQEWGGEVLETCPLGRYSLLLQVIRFKAATHTKYFKYLYHFLSLDNQSEQDNCSGVLCL